MTSERVHHPHLLGGILLNMLAVFLFSAMDTLAKFTLRSYGRRRLCCKRFRCWLSVALEGSGISC